MMNYFLMSPEEINEENYIERVFGITTKEVLEVSEAIENNDFTGFDFSEVITGEELRASCREANNMIVESQASRIEDQSKYRLII